MVASKVNVEDGGVLRACQTPDQRDNSRSWFKTDQIFYMPSFERNGMILCHSKQY